LTYPTFHHPSLRFGRRDQLERSRPKTDAAGGGKQQQQRNEKTNP
jgi:hypothetical protein